MKHQDGYIWKENGSWFGRWRENVLTSDGQTVRKQRAKKLCDVSDRYRCEADVRPLLDAILRPLSATSGTTSNMRFGQFVESIYLPYVSEQKRVSTSKNYKSKWHQYLKPYCSDWWMRDVRTCDAQRVLDAVARQHKNLGRSTLRHIKALLSGIFNFARQQGYFDGPNPVIGVAIPKAKAGGETYAYSLEEVTRMIMLLPEPAATVVATAAFTGLRRSELRGLLWENYTGSELHVTRSVWNSTVDEPKTPKSKAPVPVIRQLRTMLDNHRARCGSPTGPMFPNHLGKPVCLNNLANRMIIPVLRKAGMEWHGWHAFRRGLATNLNRLGVPGKTIQAILRHSNLSTTMNVYVKSVEEDSVRAMQTLESVLCSDCAVNPSDDSSAQVN